jgi:hypothetical protein
MKSLQHGFEVEKSQLSFDEPLTEAFGSNNHFIDTFTSKMIFLNVFW